MEASIGLFLRGTLNHVETELFPHMTNSSSCMKNILGNGRRNEHHVQSDEQHESYKFLHSKLKNRLQHTSFCTLSGFRWNLYNTLFNDSLSQKSAYPGSYRRCDNNCYYDFYRIPEQKWKKSCSKCCDK